MAEKHIVEFHPSVVVAEYNGRFLMTVYDKGYIQKAYVGKPNTPGGNPTADKRGIRIDKGPSSTLEREIGEEFKRDEKVYGYTEEWTPDEEILLIREGMLRWVNGFRDYFVRVESLGEGMNVAGTGIFSVYHTEMRMDAFDCAEYNINTRRRFVTEGYEGIFNIDSLRKRAEKDPLKISCAHLTPIILNDLFRLQGNQEIPHPGNITVVKKEHIRDSYEDYLNDSDLEHGDDWLKH